MADLKVFTKDILKAEDSVLVKFGAPWCGPCRQMGPILDALSGEGYPIYEVNTDENPTLGAEYGIRGLPTFLVFQEGKEVARVSGAHTKKDLIDLLEI